jgi:hypothetical protein
LFRDCSKFYGKNQDIDKDNLFPIFPPVSDPYFALVFRFHG